ncbi:hypothetical protein BOTCAL_0242g00010 [Botryotinia calthae]|uniref:HNH nuclease domain-containing protein n=1 Tax=Botryotinia calthae TaxID=38488 RepID=A0A4Y8CZJ4_9HELO|nr:hypothetical protein BOTCAL_0242g00010 [Botryotinia calthae]
MNFSPTIPDRTRDKGDKQQGKEIKACNTTVQWPAQAQVLREALKEMDEQQEKMELKPPPGLSMSQGHTHREAWYKRKNEYLEAIQDSLLGRKRKAKFIKADNKKRLKKAHIAHTDLMLQVYVQEKQRSSTQQTEFRKSLIDFYGVKRQGLHEEEMWCVINGSWGKPSNFVAAHIMPAKLQDAQLKHIFGDDASDELFSVKNGLMLEKQIESCFDNFQLAIVPCLTDQNCWELRVLDKHLLKMDHYLSSTKFEKLHGKKLEFLNDNRPRKRYLYYHWLVCISIASRKKMNMARIKDEKERFAKCWGTPGRYLREEMIAALIGYVGHKVPTKKILGQNENEDGDEEDEEDDEDDDEEDDDDEEEEEEEEEEDSSED